MDQIKGILDQVGDQLSTTASSEAVIGEPLELGEVTIVPLSRVSVGVGAAGGAGEGDFPEAHKRKVGPGHPPGKGQGGGAGGGARIRPVAVAVFTKEGVEILPVPARHGKLDKLMESVPQLVERIKKVVDDKESK